MSSDEAKILLVEDNSDDEALALRAFRHHNISAADVVVARDGVEALDFLFARGGFQQRENKAQPKVVLLDLKLPRVDGFEVLKAMRADARTRHLPVVVLTSSSEETDIRNSYDVGANSYIRKPVNYRKFVDVVETIGEYWLDLNKGLVSTA